MKTLFTFAILHIFFLNTISQTPFNSGAVIEEGIKLHDQQEYKKAIALYKTVSRNDTNYVRALYEMALSYSQDSNYNAAIEACDLVVQGEDKEYELDALTLKGSILDDLEKIDDALKIYDSALSKYPRAQNLLLNKAITLMRLKKMDEAQKILQELLIANPYYASAHMRLASCALKKGRVIPAMMSLFTYLLLDPDGPQHLNAIKLLGNISSNTDDITEALEKRNGTEEVFGRIEQVILSKMALDKKYKLQTDLDDPIIRQLQAMMELIEYDADNNDFWMQFYVPVYKKLFSSKSLEPAVNLAFSNLSIESIQRYIKKNTKELKQVAVEIATYFDLIRTSRELSFSKREKTPQLYFYNEDGLYGKGKLDEKKNPIGDWEYYYTNNGNIKSKGHYNAGGKQHGKWIFYYASGELSGTEEWNNGVRSGEDAVYYQNGNLSSKSIYQNDRLNGIKEVYFAIGTLHTKASYKDDQKNGPYTELYPYGEKHVEATYKDDKLEGNYKSHYNNGRVETDANYTNGELNGSYKSYHDNGQLSFEGTYQNGKITGPAKLYHENGKLKETRTYNNDKLAGENKEYDEEGILTSEIFYEDGLAKGLAKYYDDDGKLFSTFLFEKDILKEAKYYDKQGKEIASSQRKNKSIELTVYNPHGYKASFAVYNDAGQKTGVNTYFYNSGKIKETNDFIKGQLEGKSTGYFENGKKQYEITYKENEKNGEAKYYHPDGSLKTKGWYTADAASNDWENYTIKGIVSSRYSYLNDDLHGYNEVNHPNGKRDYEEVYRYGWIVAVNSFDTSGNKIFTASLPNSTGKYVGMFANGKRKYEGELVKGELEGPFTSYFFDGSIRSTKTYIHGLLNGPFNEYYYGGKPSIKGEYKMGKKTGVWKYYNDDGKLYREEPYTNDEINGKSLYYYDNGKVEYELEYKNGERNGSYKYYAPDGQLIFILYYKDGEPTAYSYNNSNGQLAATVLIPGGTGKVEAFYSNGKKSFETTYADGKINGSYKLYYPDGKIMYEREDHYGITTGKIKQYHPTGNLQSEYTYYLDELDGPFKEYHENGKVKQEGTFWDGFQNGILTNYDNTGKIISKMHFYYGVLLNVTRP
jgi:uncharacterized protein